MAFDVERLMQLWSDPLPDTPAAEELFRLQYTDPVIVNGMPLTASDLVSRARRLQNTLDRLEREIVDEVQSDGKVAVAFVIRGRQVGPLATTAGDAPPSGRPIELRVIDILTLSDDGRISSIWMVSDELGVLNAIDAVALVSQSGATGSEAQ